MNGTIAYTQTGHGKAVNQDGAVATGKIAVCFDGCSACEYAQKGVRWMCDIVRTNAKQITCENFASIMYQALYEFILVNSNEERCTSEMYFTIVACIEEESEFTLFTAGDGYIITIDHEDKVQYFAIKNDLSMMNGEAPGYLFYNFYPIEYGYNTNIGFNQYHFPKTGYKKVYVASDGARFINSFPKGEKEAFDKALILGDSGKIEEILKRNSAHIKDDISIATQ